MKKTKRKLIVEHCDTVECPFCFPDSYRKSYNWCHAFGEVKRINSNVKTFPTICPLEETDE